MFSVNVTHDECHVMGRRFRVELSWNRYGKLGSVGGRPQDVKMLKNSGQSAQTCFEIRTRHFTGSLLAGTVTTRVCGSRTATRQGKLPKLNTSKSASGKKTDLLGDKRKVFLFACVLRQVLMLQAGLEFTMSQGCPYTPDFPVSTSLVLDHKCGPPHLVSNCKTFSY